MSVQNGRENCSCQRSLTDIANSFRSGHGLAVQLSGCWEGPELGRLAVRGPAASLLLVLTRRLPPADPAIEIFGEQALLTHWLEHTPF